MFWETASTTRSRVVCRTSRPRYLTVAWNVWPGRLTVSNVTVTPSLTWPIDGSGMVS